MAGWGWRRRLSWWITLGLGGLIGGLGFLVRVAALSVLVGENLWVVITGAAASLLDRFALLFGLGAGLEAGQVQVVALLLSAQRRRLFARMGSEVYSYDRNPRFLTEFLVPKVFGEVMSLLPPQIETFCDPFL